MISDKYEKSFNKILELLSLAEDLLDKVASDGNNLDYRELLLRLDIVDDFIDHITNAIESLITNYKDFVNSDLDKAVLQDNIKEQVIKIMLSLNECRVKLLKRLEDE
jgi:hypothetical protein